MRRNTADVLGSVPKNARCAVGASGVMLLGILGILYVHISLGKLINRRSPLINAKVKYLRRGIGRMNENRQDERRITSTIKKNPLENGRRQWGLTLRQAIQRAHIQRVCMFAVHT